MRFAGAIACLLFIAACGSARASLEADLAYDRAAQNLELLRNQIELTIENHSSLSHDLARQRHEFEEWGVFLRIPVANRDLKTDSAIIDSIRRDLEATAPDSGGFRVAGAGFVSGWRAAPPRLPREVSFDEGFRFSEDQLVDRRELVLEVGFTGAVPADRGAWFAGLQPRVRRLLEPVDPAQWRGRGKRLAARVRIYRYRDVKYPRYVAPDLSRYAVPRATGAAADGRSAAQQSAERRIQLYRRQIVELWPKAQPYLDDLRAFALNDLRMSFFLKHANVR